MVLRLGMLRRDLTWDEVAAAASLLAKAGIHLPPETLGRVRSCLFTGRGPSRASPASAYLHLIDPEGRAEAEELFRHDGDPVVRSEALGFGHAFTPRVAGG